MGRALAGGGPRRAKASRVSMGGRGAVAAVSTTPWPRATRRRSISTKRPEIGRFDHAALAVVWTSTSHPLPLFSAVTRGVPSSSRAQVLAARSRDGRARTWRRMRTSAGTARPWKGLAAEKGARVAGCRHDMLPPIIRSPWRSATGSRTSVSPARRRPAKRTATPPLDIQSSRRLRASSCRRPGSASTSIASSRSSRSVTAPRRTSVKGFNALSR